MKCAVIIIATSQGVEFVVKFAAVLDITKLVCVFHLIAFGDSVD